MIKKKITIVLGAGASCEYGFPLGSELMEAILNHPFNDSLESFEEASNTIRKHGMVSSSMQKTKLKARLFQSNHQLMHKVLRFYSVFNRTASASVDYFLQQNPEHQEAGKFLVAHIISQFEYNYLTQHYYLMPAGKGFYRDIISAFSLASSAFINDEIEIKFLTFNYDRSLELYLINAVKNTFSGNLSDKILSAVEIIHIHGDLGPLRNTSMDPLRVENINVNHDLDVILEKSKGLRIIHEDQNREHIKILRSHIDNADKVYVMGFGFHPENTSLLFDNYDVILKEVEFYCTAYGALPSEVKMFKAFTHGRIPLESFVDCSCSNLLRYSQLFSFKEDYSIYSKSVNILFKD